MRVVMTNRYLLNDFHVFNVQRCNHRARGYMVFENIVVCVCVCLERAW